MVRSQLAYDKESVTCRTAEFFSLMGNSCRLTILLLLLDQEVNVGDLARKIGLSQSALSQHLAKLRTAGLVQTRREAQTVFYTTTHPAVRSVIKSLEEISTHVPARNF